MKALRWLGIILLTLVCILAFLWAFGAIYYDGYSKWLAGVHAAAIVAVFVFLRSWRWKLGIFAAWFTLVLGWWLTLKPSNTAEWQEDVAQLAWAEVDGDSVTLHNVRNFEYQSDTQFTPRWETRRVKLSKITGIDLAINYWGSPWIAHPIMSFQFSDEPPLGFSIETRKRVGQTYSAIGGLYRQFTLVFVVADENDVIRVRTNYRKGEEVYLYRTTLDAAQAQLRFKQYLDSINSLRLKPRWYNALTTNCTTSIRNQNSSASRIPWDWRIILNGKADEMLYEQGAIASGGLSFEDLKKRANIGALARTENGKEFSERIRATLPKN